MVWETRDRQTFRQRVGHHRSPYDVCVTESVELYRSRTSRQSTFPEYLCDTYTIYTEFWYSKHLASLQDHWQLLDPQFIWHHPDLDLWERGFCRICCSTEGRRRPKFFLHYSSSLSVLLTTNPMSLWQVLLVKKFILVFFDTQTKIPFFFPTLKKNKKMKKNGLLKGGSHRGMFRLLKCWVTTHEMCTWSDPNMRTHLFIQTSEIVWIQPCDQSLDQVSENQEIQKSALTCPVNVTWSHPSVVLKRVLYYESVKWEIQTRPVNESRCDERLKTKVEESTLLGYTGR
jgi:hypothetical protein